MKNSHQNKYIIGAQVYTEAIEENDDCDSWYYQDWLEWKLWVGKWQNLFQFLNNIKN